MNEFKCVTCYQTITGEIYESDGFTEGEINTYCLNCFYENVKVGFNNLNLFCKCGQPLVVGEGSNRKEFGENFLLGTIEYICPKINNEEKYIWDFPTQIEIQAMQNHTRVVKEACREKSVAEKMIDQLEGTFQNQKEAILIEALIRSKDETINDFNHYECDIQVELEILELERKSEIKKAVIKKLIEFEQK